MGEGKNDRRTTMDDGGVLGGVRADACRVRCGDVEAGQIRHGAV